MIKNSSEEMITMKTKENRSIAIVATSPLQIMLAHNICKMYLHSYVKCFIMTYNNDNRYAKCEKLAQEYGYDVQAVHVTNRLLSHYWGIVKKCILSFINDEDFDMVIQGIFSTFYFYAFSLNLLKKGGELIITDDGTATFLLEDTKYMDSVVKSPIYKGIFALMNIRKIKHGLFYSIFDNIKSSYFNFKKLKMDLAIQNRSQEGVYFLGTFQEAFASKFKPAISSEQFDNLVKQSVDYLHCKYPNEKIIYTPHGREWESNSLNICDRYQLEYMPTEVSVEVDYPKARIYPKVIVGFKSTALFTLKAIFPLAEVIDIWPSNVNFINKDQLLKSDTTADAMGISHVKFTI